MSKVILSPEEKKAIMREQGRLRAAKFYANKENKERVLEVKKVKYYKTEAKNPRKIKEVIEIQPISEIITLPSKTAHSQKEGKLSSVEEEVKFVPNKPAPPKEMSPRNKAKYNLAMVELQKQQDKEEAQHEEKHEPEVKTKNVKVSEIEDDNSDTYDKIIKQLNTLKYDSQLTLKKYIENFKTIVKILDMNSYSKFIKFIVNKPDEVIKKFESATYGKDKKSYSLNSIRDYINLIAFYIDKLKIPIDSEDKETYTDMAAILVAQSHRQTEKNKDKEVPPINEYVENVAKQYGKNSLNSLLVKLLVATYGRDDLNLHLVKSTQEANKDFNLNYLVLEDDKITVLINEFKTSKKYGQKKIVLDDDLEQHVRNYIDKKHIQYGDLMFPNLRLSQAISVINKKLGYTGDGAINLIRKMVNSDKYLDENITPYEELQMAKKFGHSIQTNNTYKRKVVSAQPPTPKYNFV